MPIPDNYQGNRRRPIRLKSHDYSQAGGYFVTMCTQARACRFGVVEDGMVRLNEAGRMIQAIWEEMPARYVGLSMDAFVVMPNHLHGIVILVGAPVPAPARIARLAQGSHRRLPLLKNLRRQRYRCLTWSRDSRR
jgi:REP element-mobilizing transposase RayT